MTNKSKEQTHLLDETEIKVEKAVKKDNLEDENVAIKELETYFGSKTASL